MLGLKPDGSAVRLGSNSVQKARRKLNEGVTVFACPDTRIDPGDSARLAEDFAVFCARHAPQLAGMRPSHPQNADQTVKQFKNLSILTHHQRRSMR